MRKISSEAILKFKDYLVNEEKSHATTGKYIHDVKVFYEWLNKTEVSKIKVLEYKEKLTEKYAPKSVNSHISSINSFFEFLGWHDCKVKMLKIQRQIFISNEKELTKREYEKLLMAAKNKNNERLYYVMQTICSTGIRVSELKYITVEALNVHQATIRCKGKMRIVLLPKKLCKNLKKYAKEQAIAEGSIFVSKKGNPLNRTNIWMDMKKLCEAAGVSKEKVFPHNLRHLFARTYYSLQKDVVRLADILGHSNINTTRIYTIESGDVHRTQIERLGFLKC